MSNMNADPLEDLIADGKLYTRPIGFGSTAVLTLDLDFLIAQVTAKMSAIYLNHDRILVRYGSDQGITAGITAMANYLGAQVYNKLRSVLERFAPFERTARMNPRCPVPGDMEFPAWLSSTLSCIGPCPVKDGPKDCIYVFATTETTMQTYGRSSTPHFIYGYYVQFLDILREIGVHLAPFDHQGMNGSYYPTIRPTVSDQLFTLYATVHPGHYENEDVARIALVTNELGVTPFEDIGITVGYVDDETALQALAAVAAPPGIPHDQDANSVGRPVGGIYRVNYFGIQPATAATGTTPAQARGMYVIGRGIERRFQSVLTRGITANEIHQILFYRLLPTK